MADPLDVVSGGLQIGSAIAGIFGAGKKKKQAKKVRRELDVQKGLGLQRQSVELDISNQERISAFRQNRLQSLEQQRQLRVRQADILSAATNSGAGLGSSGVGGALGAAQSNLGFNLSLINTAEAEGNQRFSNISRLDEIGRKQLESQTRAARAANKAGSISSTIGQIQSAFGAVGSIVDIFNKPGGAGKNSIFDLK